MHLTRHQSSATDGDVIYFPVLECWNPVSKVATIAAEVNKRRISCRISLAVLQERFHASADDPMSAVAENRAAIQAVARKLIEREAFEEDGSILLRNRNI